MNPSQSKMSMRSMGQSKMSLNNTFDTWQESTEKDYLVSRDDLRPTKTKAADDIMTWFNDIQTFLWNGRTGLIMGFTPLRWAKVLLSYFCFLCCLVICNAILYAMVMEVYIDDNYPSLQNMETPILGNPGMGFRPMPDQRTTLIRFEQGKPSSYKPYADHIQAYLEQYENDAQESEVFIDCTSLEEKNRDTNKACRFNIDQLGTCTWQRDYGYDDGQPCVLLKLNKVYGWIPEPYNNATRPIDLPENSFTDGHIAVTCEGEDPMDRENMGPLSFYPKHGFPIYYYPYLNQEGYRQPLVFVQFKRPQNGVLINVWCKAWAKNMFHHRFDRAGSIHFELVVD